MLDHRISIPRLDRTISKLVERTQQLGRSRHGSIHLQRVSPKEKLTIPENVPGTQDPQRA